MKRLGTRSIDKTPLAVSLALTWDGARWPVRSLPATAQKFLQENPRAISCPGQTEMAKLLAKGSISEIRICWVPKLKGGDETLASPFSTLDGLRLNFQSSKPRLFGYILGMVYRKERSTNRTHALREKT